MSLWRVRFLDKIDKMGQDGTRWLSGAYDPVNLEILFKSINGVQ